MHVQALFRFLAHWLATLGRSAAASGIYSLKNEMLLSTESGDNTGKNM
ncbi:hypothetical protein [Escherichia coli]|nr:hypothetical protein [Escherichia coli]EFZ6384849.1 hypothetical protein [Shigella sonnei]EJU0289054.1 hypothetical protein [Shigella sonnei]EKT9503733.1 hypothetical protein [Escherichia coli]EKY1724491.1 hypothetical protein [Escherichia coli]ELQ7406169.1 hypothetical protein [Escherichia coli]